MRTFLLLLSVFIVFVAPIAACKADSPAVSAAIWPEADAIFHSDPRWLGADGAYSVDLGNERTLWLFGDTFIAREPREDEALHQDGELGGDASDAFFIRNSVAIQTGRDPSSALMGFAWSQRDDGSPGSFLPEDSANWFWPVGGARVGSSLLLLWERMQTPEGSPSGFEQIATRAILVANPDDAPAAWMITEATLPTDAKGLFLGNAVMHEGGFVYAYAEGDGILHDIYLARFPDAAATRGDLSTPEWWCGQSFENACAAPAKIVSEGAPELSVHADGRIAPFVMVQSEGYGATTLALRTAPAPEGPWSAAESFFRPPESDLDDAFIYAGKGHHELAGADLVATYVPSTFGNDLDPSLYHPHFVRITYR